MEREESPYKYVARRGRKNEGERNRRPKSRSIRRKARKKENKLARKIEEKQKNIKRTVEASGPCSSRAMVEFEKNG